MGPPSLRASAGLIDDKLNLSEVLTMTVQANTAVKQPSPKKLPFKARLMKSLRLLWKNIKRDKALLLIVLIMPELGDKKFTNRPQMITVEIKYGI